MASRRGNTTQPTKNPVARFLDSIEVPTQRADAQRLCALMTEVTGAPPVLWGTSIVGFGLRHYRYESGREGDTMRIGFAPRKGRLVVYLADALGDLGPQLARLGPHEVGKGCVSIKSLSDVSESVLRSMVVLTYRASGG